MGKLDGKVAFITGAARGQGRSHAVRLAAEGADIIGVDICAQIDSVPYALASREDLDDTKSAVEALGRKAWMEQADVRDRSSLQTALDRGMEALGPVDIVLANAGIGPISIDDPSSGWQNSLDVNLTGVFNTVEVALPTMIAGGRGGSIVITSSTGGTLGVCGPSPAGLGYAAAKHGVVGLMRSYANNLAPNWIRVNTIHPTGVRTPMVVNEAMGEFLAQNPSLSANMQNALPVDMVEPEDISNAIAWLVSDDGRYVTGVSLPVDAGFINKK
jgi:SDR family mycofactocin-dependent oxidoreductase